MIEKSIYHTFKKGSKTFFTNSLFFPKDVRNDIFIFYSFVRVADDFVDSIPAQIDAFNQFKQNYNDAVSGKKTHVLIIDSFVEMIKRRGIPLEWIEAFFNSMTLDTYKKTYLSMEELDVYLYGSAEIIGLVMAHVLFLPKESFLYAKMLGRAFQYINFIRDIAEDIKLGRCYFPSEVLQELDHTQFLQGNVSKKPEIFSAFVRREIQRYYHWQSLGEKGFSFIPKRYLLPIKTAADMYRYTARSIEKNPLVLFNKKIKPSKFRIMTTLAINSLFLRV